MLGATLDSASLTLGKTIIVENSLNSHGIQSLECASDHPPRPVIPAPAPVTLPGWRAELAPFTCSIGWSDDHGCTYNLTIRDDSLDGILPALTRIKRGIRRARRKATVANPGTPSTEVLEKPGMACPIHDVPMQRRISKRTKGHYFSHALPGNSLCFGRKKT